MKTVYLAGKITGDPTYQLKFLHAADQLQMAGFAVANPAVLSEGFTYEAYIRMSMAMLNECDSVCFLSDWKDSPGALHEYSHATLCEKEIFYFDDWRDKRNKYGKIFESEARAL